MTRPTSKYNHSQAGDAYPSCRESNNEQQGREEETAAMSAELMNGHIHEERDGNEAEGGEDRNESLSIS